MPAQRWGELEINTQDAVGYDYLKGHQGLAGAIN